MHVQAFRKKNLATYHKWVWELKRLYRSPLIIINSENRRNLRIPVRVGLNYRKALSTPAYLRTLIRYTPYIWKQINEILVQSLPFSTDDCSITERIVYLSVWLRRLSSLPWFFDLFRQTSQQYTSTHPDLGKSPINTPNN